MRSTLIWPNSKWRLRPRAWNLKINNLRPYTFVIPQKKGNDKKINFIASIFHFCGNKASFLAKQSKFWSPGQKIWRLIYLRYFSFVIPHIKDNDREVNFLPYKFSFYRLRVYFFGNNSSWFTLNRLQYCKV